MALEVTFDAAVFAHAMQRSPQAVAIGATTAMDDIKDDWTADSVDIAPIDQNALRPSINAKLLNPGTNGRVEIRANAKRNGFNYAYYIHEGEGKAVTGEKKYLDKAGLENFEKWQGWLATEIEKELRNAGW